MNATYVRLDDSPTKCVVAQGTDDELAITGYVSTRLRTLAFRLATIVSLGLFDLWLFWKPSCRRWKYRKCPLEEADVVAVENTYDDVDFCDVSTVDDRSESLSRSSSENSTTSSSDDEHPLRRIRSHSSTANTPRRQSLFNPNSIGHRTTFEDIQPNGRRGGDGTLRFFVYRGMRFVFDEDERSFTLLNGLDDRVKCGELMTRFRGWTKEEQDTRRQLFGSNTINVKITSYWTLFFKEVLNPFYVFQLASLVLWSFDDYYIYAICVLLITFISVGFELYETRMQLLTLRDMVSAANESTARIRRRDGTIETVASADLVPGDVLLVAVDANGYMMPCDALILNGSCIVDESILTGESVPVAKIAMSPTKNDEDDLFDAEYYQKHVLFSGTRVIQARVFTSGEVFALVVRTGFASSKGSLIRNVLYPKFLSFEFYREAMVFLIILGIIAISGTAYSMAIFITRGMHAKKVMTNSLDIITIVVPPTLPAAMTIGIWYSQRRLKSKQIYSTSPQRINLCGKLNLICFDKTGTLTEEGLEFNGVIPCQNGKFHSTLHDLSKLPFGPLLSCLTTCHCLTMINGDVVGDSLDLSIFESTRWAMETTPASPNSAFENSFSPTIVKPPGSSATTHSGRTASVDDLVNSPPLEVGIVRQFPFSSDLQRCTVVARRLGAYPMAVYSKGAPEQIAALCRPETIPYNFRDMIDKEAMLGHRVLALACRMLPKKTLWHHLQRMKREDLERGMEFIGVVVFRNRLKPPTTSIIDELRRAKIRCVMVTGDNLLTSLCVARECHLIFPYDEVFIVSVSETSDDEEMPLELNFKAASTSGKDSYPSYQNGAVELEGVANATRFAISGRDFAVVRERSPGLLKQIVSRGVVFARMRPHQKAQLVEIFQDLGYVVGMCGDGANDCSAMKAAHAGVSLSDLEASVAAPFTCRVQTIECIPALIKEGRCALVTSFGVFKYMTMYSMIQFASVIALYSMNMFFADYMYLFIDLFITTIIAVLMARTEASEKLSRTQPTAKIFALPNILSLITHLVVVIAIQLAAFFYLRSRIWYGPVYPDPNEELSLSWETTTLFFVSCYQYLIVALVFSSGSPYRKPFYTNFPFVAALLLFVVIITVMLFVRIRVLDVWLELIPIPRSLWRFQLALILLALVNLAISVLIEHFFARADEPPNAKIRLDKSQVLSPRFAHSSSVHAFRNNSSSRLHVRVDSRSSFK